MRGRNQMVEVIVEESIDKPFVVRLLGQVPQIHIGSNMPISQIRKELANELNVDEFQKFEELWTNDTYPRKFKQEGDFLKITDES